MRSIDLAALRPVSLPKMREALAVYHRKNGPGRAPSYLFRGERKDWGAIIPSVARPDLKLSPAGFGQLQRLWSAAASLCAGLDGYHPRDALDALAIFQHYGIPSPLIDFTGSPEVAEFFAYYGHVEGDVAYLYILDCEAVRSRSDLLLIDHDFLMYRPEDGGIRHRWLRQDGFALTIKEWRDLEAVRKINLRESTYPEVFAEVIAFRFPTPAHYRLELADVLDPKDDPIPRKLPELLRLFCGSRLGALDPALAEKIDAIYQGPGVPAEDEPITMLFWKLPWWGKVAFCARCARRCQGVLQRGSNLPEERLAMIEAALTYAERAAEACTSSPPGVARVFIEAQGAADSLAHLVERAAGAAAGGANVSAQDTSGQAALEASVDASLRFLLVAYNKDVLPGSALATAERQMRADLAFLFAEAGKSRREDAPVPAGFGPLW